MMIRLSLALVGAAVLALVGCKEEPHFTEPMVLGGETISAESLNRGKELYTQNCYACHGPEGNGQGPAAAYLRPQPRDFRVGTFKFGLSINGLPHTQDLVTLVQRGLTGTAMLPWDVPESQLVDIINYIKTFSPKWVCKKSAECGDKCTLVDESGNTSCYSESKLGKRIEVSPDPWVGREAEAIDRGIVVYHVSAQCRTCHPSYITQEKFYEITRGDNEWAYGDLVYRSQLKESNEYKVQILPIDFLFHPIKNLQPGEDAKTQREWLYKVIGSGINGAAMPTWKGSIPDEDLWALAYYIQSLHAVQGTPKARELRASLDNQPKFEPPAEGAAQANDSSAQGDSETL